jgi:hypothetical protein
MAEDETGMFWFSSRSVSVSQSVSVSKRPRIGGRFLATDETRMKHGFLGREGEGRAFEIEIGIGKVLEFLGRVFDGGTQREEEAKAFSKSGISRGFTNTLVDFPSFGSVSFVGLTDVC